MRHLKDRYLGSDIDYDDYLEHQFLSSEDRRIRNLINSKKMKLRSIRPRLSEYEVNRRLREYTDRLIDEL